MRSAFLFASVVFAASAVAHASPRDGQATLRVPEDHPTISAAIAAANAGDRIKVANGIYRERLLIDKPLEIEGTDPELTIIDGESADLPSVGQVRIVAAGDVEFSKFTIVNAGRAIRSIGGTDYQFHVAVCPESPVAGVTYEIHNARMLRAGFAAPAELGYGLYSLGGLEHLHFHHCLVAEQNNCAVYTVSHAGPMTIEDNRLELGTVGADPCFFSSLAGLIDTPQRVRRNWFDMGTPTSQFGFYAAVTVVSAGFEAGGGFSDFVISDNLIENITENRRGINFIAQPDGMLRGAVDGNQILGNGGYTGIAVWGRCEDVLVSDNLITGITGLGLNTPGTNGGIRLRSFGPGYSPIGTRIVDNDIEALRGISVEGDTSASLIEGNRIRASGPASVDLGVASSANSVIRNLLRSPLGRGNQTVLDAGTGNSVRSNR
jgi:hypothetical protein